MKHPFITGFKHGFAAFGHTISTLVNSVLLSVVYFIGVGASALVAKIFNKHFFPLKHSKESSYWTDLRLGKKPIEDHYRQF